jgi:L1 cell adhesion molecule like protein
MTIEEIQSSRYAVGADIGTSMSCVAVIEGDRVEVIANDQGNRTTPSIVAFTDDEILIGDAAKNQMISNVENTIFDAKRFIGRSFDDPIVQKEIKNVPYKVVNKNNRPVFVVQSKGEEKTYTAEEITSFVIIKMKNIAEAYLGEEVKDMVITVPAYFNDEQRQATKDAGRIAGVNVLRIINEPTAGCLCYKLDSCHNNKETNVLIFDCGAGTHDVSLLTVEDGIFEVKATAGDNHLGGSDIDQNVTKWAIEEFKKKTGCDIHHNKKAVRKLRNACERAKKTLSSAKTAMIEVDSLYEGRDCNLVLSRAKFEDINMDFFKKTLEPVNTVLSDAGISKSQVHEVVLVGGTTRIPKIQSMLSDYFNGKELCSKINPDEAVGYGAAVQAGILKNVKSKATDSILLLDVTPLTLGIETSGEIMTKLIERGTTIPTKKTQVFSTYTDNQPSARIKILEGERPMSKDNNLLGEFQIDGIPPAPRGIPQIEVTYDISADGILKTTAKIVGSDVEKTLEIKNDNNRLSQEQIEKMIKEAEQYQEEDKKLRERIEAKNQLENFLYASKENQKENNEYQDFIKKEIEWLESHTTEDAQVYKDRMETVIKGLSSFQPKEVPTEKTVEETKDEPVIQEVD